MVAPPASINFVDSFFSSTMFNKGEAAHGHRAQSRPGTFESCYVNDLIRLHANSPDDTGSAKSIQRNFFKRRALFMAVGTACTPSIICRRT